VIGRRKHNQPISNLALDRILTIDYDFNVAFLEGDFDADAFYKNVVGVTVNTGLQPRKIELWIDAINALYVITKPLHNTQRLIKTNADGSIIIHLLLIENYELDRLLLGFGNGLEVIKPEKLRKRMQTIVYKTLERYQEIL
jgi:predicted DNA-binding transcriptional regulator YafY